MNCIVDPKIKDFHSIWKRSLWYKKIIKESSQSYLSARVKLMVDLEVKATESLSMLMYLLIKFGYRNTSYDPIAKEFDKTLFEDIKRMGSSGSCLKFKMKPNGKVDAAPADYTEAEINIVQKQWSVAMRNLDSVGYKLFAKLFQYKDIMAKFDFAVANNLDFQKSMNDARLSFHIRRVFHTINTVVSCLNDGDFVASQLEHVGAIHAEYGLQATHLARFKDVMLETLEEAFKEGFQEDSKTAWSKIVDAIAKYMLKEK
ncbi:uncharacterized protein [Clytia hemisphaerica]